MSHTVRTTMRPDEEIEVGDAEFLDLQRQGLLVGEPEPSHAPPSAAPSNPAVPVKKLSSGTVASKES